MGDEPKVTLCNLYKPNSTKTLKTNIVNKRIAEANWIRDYNYKGQLLKATELDESGKPITIFMREYDEKGNEVKLIRDDGADGKPDYINTSEYDDKGRLIGTTNDYDADGNIDNFTLYEYYDNGQKKEEIRYMAKDNDSDFEFKVVKYDKKGNMLMDAHISDPLKYGYINLFSQPNN